MRENGLKRRALSFLLAFTMVFSLCTNFNLTVNAETGSEADAAAQSTTETPTSPEESDTSLQDTPAMVSDFPVDDSTTTILGGANPVNHDLSAYLNWDGENASSIKINGTELKEGETTKVEAGSTVEIVLGWTFTDNAEPTSESDVFTYTIPNGINMASKTGTLYFGTQNVGTYVIDGNTISLAYTSKSFFEESGRGGKITVSGILSQDIIDEATKDSYTFSFPADKSFTIDMDKDHSKDAVSVTKKSAKLDTSKGLNNLTADFVVEIKAVGEYQNLVFQDEMGSYLSLNGDVSFYTDESCSTPYTGSVTKTSDQPSNGFKYTIANLADQTIYAKYTVNVDKKIYTITNIYDSNQTNLISNTAKIETEDGKKDSSSNRVEFDSRTWVEKKGSYNATTEQIDWTITINKGGNFDISGTTLKDVLSDSSCTLVEGSFKTNISGLTYEQLMSGTYVFPEGSTGEYTISYSTTKGSTSDTSVVTKSNTATVKPWGDSSEISGKADVPIGTNWDYVDKACLTTGNSQIVKWQITVHVPKTGIDNLVVSDVIPSGMSYVDGSFSVTSGFSGDVTVAENQWNKGTYEFTFGKIEGTGQAFDIVFTLQTKIDQLPSSTTTYTNYATVNHVQDKASYEYKAENYLEKSTNNGQVTDGKMNWYLHIKHLPSESKSAVITDILPDGMSYVEGSLKTADQQWWGYDDSTVHPSGVNPSDIAVSVSGNTITFTLTGTALSYAKNNDNLWIRYTTEEKLSISDAGTTKTYKNEAHITVDDVSFPSVSAEVTHKIDKETFIDKYTEYNADTAPYVNYTITVNEKGFKLSSDNQLTLVDQMGSALDYKEGSLKIDGVTAGSDVLSYDEANRQLTIKVTDGEKHTITYQASVNLNVGEKLDSTNAFNNVTLYGKSESGVDKQTTLNTVVVDSSGSSWSEGVSVSVYKYDSEDRTKALSGAEFSIYKISLNDNNEVTGKELVKTAVTGEDGYAYLYGLNRNTLYMLQETKAPDGYKGVLSAQYFAFQETNGKLTVPTQITAAGLTESVMIVEGKHTSYSFSVANEESKEHEVKISKQDINGAELAGAKLTITDESGKTTVDSWTSDGKIHEVSLQPGTYVLKEEATPSNSYVLAKDITFTVDKDGKVTVAGKDVSQVTMVDEYSEHEIEISKIDATNSKELKGAELKITDASGKVVDKWTSDGSKHIVKLAVGEYTLVEDQAPLGYFKAESITFAVDGDGLVTINGESLYPHTVVMEDKRNPDEYGGGKHDVKISKLDSGNGKELEGAQLTVKDADGNVVESWTSDGSTHIVKVNAGEYTLVEDQAPLGYEKAESVTFKVDEEGKVTVNGKEVEKVTMEDARSEREVEISKVDASNSKELPGAKLKITDADGNLVEEWTSTEESHFVKLTYGEYTLTEITAPKGYEVAESIKFTVGKDGKVTSDTVGAVENNKVTMKDEPTIDSKKTTPEKPKTTTPSNTSSSGSSTPSGTSAPKTGDFDMPQSWWMLLMLALAGLGTAGYAYKKRK